jgi:hypothetical protein
VRRKPIGTIHKRGVYGRSLYEYCDHFRVSESPFAILVGLCVAGAVNRHIRHRGVPVGVLSSPWMLKAGANATPTLGLLPCSR